MKYSVLYCGVSLSNTEHEDFTSTLPQVTLMLYKINDQKDHIKISKCVKKLEWLQCYLVIRILVVAYNELRLHSRALQVAVTIYHVTIDQCIKAGKTDLHRLQACIFKALQLSCL